MHNKALNVVSMWQKRLHGMFIVPQGLEMAIQNDVFLSDSHPPRKPLGLGLKIKYSTLWLCQNSYWKWPFIVSFPIKNGDFP